MNITIREEGNCIIVKFEGRLDTVAAEKAKKELDSLYNNSGHDVMIDCEQLEYISSSGLRILLSIRKAAALSGNKVTILNISSDIEKVFAMTGFDTLFDIQKK